MWLSLKTSSPFASQLTFLLHKHPEKPHLKEWSQVKACLYFYSSEPQELGFTIQLTPTVPTKSFTLSYAHCSIALNKYFSSAMNGLTDEAQELVDHHFHWTVQMGLHSDSDLLPDFYNWIRNTQGFVSVSLQEGSISIQLECPLKILLRILYVLLIAADQKSHLSTHLGSRDLLLEKGKDWLEAHPCKISINNNFLKYDENTEAMHSMWQVSPLKAPESEWLILGSQKCIEEICTKPDSKASMATHCYTDLLKSKDLSLQDRNYYNNLLLWHPKMEKSKYLLILIRTENCTTISNALSRYQWWVKKDWQKIYLLVENNFETWKTSVTDWWTYSIDTANERYSLYQLNRISDAS